MAVSTTARPVTHVALTAVNSATPGLADPSPVRMIGSISSRVPRPHSTANDVVMLRVGERRTIRACCACERATTSEVPGRCAGGRGRVCVPGGLLVVAPGAQHPTSRLVRGRDAGPCCEAIHLRSCIARYGPFPRAVRDRGGATVGG